MWKLETCTGIREHSAACVQLLRNRCGLQLQFDVMKGNVQNNIEAER